MATRAAIYYRVSTRDQNPDLQVDELRQYAGKRQFDIVGEFVDQASGTDRQRPQLEELMAVVRKRQTDVVLVWAFDRFARSTSHLVNTLEELQGLGVDFISYTQQLDTSNGTGKLVFTVLAGIAEFEREMLRERVRAGMAAAKKRGKHVGRKPISDRKVKRVRELRGQGLSFRNIAKQVGVSVGTAAGYCKSERDGA